MNLTNFHSFSCSLFEKVPENGNMWLMSERGEAAERMKVFICDVILEMDPSDWLYVAKKVVIWLHTEA